MYSGSDLWSSNLDRTAHHVIQPDRQLAERVARARYNHTPHDAGRPWRSLTDAQRTSHIDTAHGYLRALTDVGADLIDKPAGTGPSHSVHRLTATVRGTDDHPIERDLYAAHLQAQMDSTSGALRRSLLTNAEAATVAALLDELVGVYPGEDLAHLAHGLAARLNDQLGI